MRFSDGGKACLEVGSNKSYTLPLLGELRNIIEQNEDEFNKAIAIKQILEKHMMSKLDFSLITLMKEKACYTITVDQ